MSFKNVKPFFLLIDNQDQIVAVIPQEEFKTYLRTDSLDTIPTLYSTGGDKNTLWGFQLLQEEQETKGWELMDAVFDHPVDQEYGLSNGWEVKGPYNGRALLDDLKKTCLQEIRDGYFMNSPNTTIGGFKKSLQGYKNVTLEVEDHQGFSFTVRARFPKGKKVYKSLPHDTQWIYLTDEIEMQTRVAGVVTTSLVHRGSSPKEDVATFNLHWS